MGGASGVCASFEAAEYGGVKYSAWCEAPPKIGGCTPNRAGEAGTLGVRGIFSPVHARGKYDWIFFRRLRPAELCEACPAGRVGWGGKVSGVLWVFCGLPPGPACPAGRVRWTVGCVGTYGFLRAAARACCLTGPGNGTERVMDTLKEAARARGQPHQHPRRRKGESGGSLPFAWEWGGVQGLPLPGVRWAGPLPLSGCDNRTNACSFGGLFLKKREKTSHLS